MPWGFGPAWAGRGLAEGLAVVLVLAEVLEFANGCI